MTLALGAACWSRICRSAWAEPTPCNCWTVGREVDAVAWTAEESARICAGCPTARRTVSGLRADARPGQRALGAGPRCGDDHADAPTSAATGATWGADLRGSRPQRRPALQCAADCQSFLTAACGPPVATLTLVLNEITSAGDDAIELYNPGPEGVDLGAAASRTCGLRARRSGHGGRGSSSPPGAWEAGGLLVLRKDVDHGFRLGGSDTVRSCTTPPACCSTRRPGPRTRPGRRGAGFRMAMARVSSCEVATFGSLNAGPPPGRCGDGRLDRRGMRWPGGRPLQRLPASTRRASPAPRTAARSGRTPARGGRSWSSTRCAPAGTTPSGCTTAALRPRDLAGWAVADADYDPDQAEATADHLHRLSGTLGPGAWRVLRKGEDHAFGLGAVDSVRLLDAEGRVVDETAWEEGDAAVSWCRLPDGEGPFMACDEATLGGPNR
ncbi:MAG: hypothetical protein R3F43_14100 [bacterium]